jgi:hypothetical protein
MVVCIVMWYVCDSRLCFVLDIGFIDPLYTRLGTTSNYSAIATHCYSQITTALANIFQPAVSSTAVLW